jgi:hypothetical protein
MLVRSIFTHYSLALESTTNHLPLCVKYSLRDYSLHMIKSVVLPYIKTAPPPRTTPTAATIDPRPRPPKFHWALEAPLGAEEELPEPEAAGLEVWVMAPVGS